MMSPSCNSSILGQSMVPNLQPSLRCAWWESGRVGGSRWHLHWGRGRCRSRRSLCKASLLETGFRVDRGHYFILSAQSIELPFVILRVIDGGRAISKTAVFFLRGHVVDVLGVVVGYGSMRRRIITYHPVCLLSFEMSSRLVARASFGVLENGFWCWYR